MGPGLTRADLCWRIWVTIPTSWILPDWAGGSGARLFSFACQRQQSHLCGWSSRVWADVSHSSARSITVEIQVVTQFILMLCWMRYYDIISPSASQRHHSAVTVTSIVSHKAAETRFNQHLCSSLASWSSRGSQRSHLQTTLRSRKVNSHADLLQENNLTFHFLPSWILLFFSHYNFDVWILKSLPDVSTFQCDSLNSQLKHFFSDLRLDSISVLYFTLPWKVTGILFPSSERARVPASAVCLWNLLQIGESFHFVSLMSDWLEIKAAQKASSCSRKLQNIARYGGAHTTSTGFQGSRVEFRCFCWLTIILTLKFFFFFCKNVFFLTDGRCSSWSWCSSKLLIRFLCQQIYFSLTFAAEDLWLPSLSKQSSSLCLVMLCYLSLKTFLSSSSFTGLKYRKIGENILAALSVILKGTELK